METIWRFDINDPDPTSEGFSDIREALLNASLRHEGMRAFWSDNQGSTWHGVDIDLREFACLCVKDILGYCFGFMTEDMEHYLNTRCDDLRIKLRDEMTGTPFWGTNILVTTGAWTAMAQAVQDCPVSAAIGAMSSASYCTAVVNSDLWLATEPNLRDPVREERQRVMLLRLADSSSLNVPGGRE